QHTFRSGERVDAVVRLGQGLVPVDAKFPLEDFRRLLQATDDEERQRSRRAFIARVKKHVDDIAAKYIVPDEGTYDFALMYIPAENVYYETIVRDEELGGERSLSSHALERKVIPVSPSCFYAYLQAIVLRLHQFGVFLYQAILGARDVDRLVRFEVLSYGSGAHDGPPPPKRKGRAARVNWELLERRIAASAEAYQRPVIRKKIADLVEYYGQCAETGNLPAIPGAVLLVADRRLEFTP